MGKTPTVVLSSVNSSENEYIIKDSMGITIGRIFIVELDKKNEYCSFRMKFYKDEEENIEYLKESLRVILSSLFKNMGMTKVNVIVQEDMRTMAFTELGFILEGLFIGSVKASRDRRDELVFGIDKKTFNGGLKLRNLIIKGERIELKLLGPEDAGYLIDYYIRNKSYLKGFEPARDESFYTIEAQRKDLIENYKQYLNGTGVNFGIFKDGNFIGKVRIYNIVMGTFRNGFVGYSIDNKEQGKGYMKEALNLALEFAFEDMGLHRIEASTLVDNKKSQGVLKGCGFNEVGLNRNYMYINGEWRDHITFFKIKE